MKIRTPQHTQEARQAAEAPAVDLGAQRAACALPEAFKAQAQAPSLRGLAAFLPVASGATAVPDYDQPTVDLGLDASPRKIEVPDLSVGEARRTIELLSDWYSGYFSETASLDDYREMKDAFWTLGLGYPGTTLFRACWLHEKDVEAVMANQPLPMAQLAPNPIQCWTSSESLAEDFARGHTYVPARKGYLDVVVSAEVPGDLILARSTDAVRVLRAIQAKLPKRYREATEDQVAEIEQVWRDEDEWTVLACEDRLQISLVDNCAASLRGK